MLVIDGTLVAAAVTVCGGVVAMLRDGSFLTNQDYRLQWFYSRAVNLARKPVRAREAPYFFCANACFPRMGRAPYGDRSRNGGSRGQRASENSRGAFRRRNRGHRRQSRRNFLLSPPASMEPSKRGVTAQPAPPQPPRCTSNPARSQVPI
jgi:hypothetical protein